MLLKSFIRADVRTAITVFCVVYVCFVCCFYYGLQRSENDDNRVQLDETALLQRLSGAPRAKPKAEPAFSMLRKNGGLSSKLALTQRNISPSRNCTPDHSGPNSTAPKRGREFEFVEVVPGTVFIYSAFLDDRPNDFDNRNNGSYIRMMSVLRSSGRRRRLVCTFAGRSGRRSSSAVTYYEMCENHGQPFGGFILSCTLPPDVGHWPCVVTVSEDVPDASEHNIRVLSLRPIGDKDDFRICVPPLFGKLDYRRIVEFVEVSRILGAERIIFYDYQTTEETAKTLEYYEHRGYVDVVPWLYPDLLDRNSWYHGQLIAIQDCLYRNMAFTEFLLFNDVDEYVVPHEFDDWKQVVERTFKVNQCAFQFHSSFFPDVNTNKTIVLSATRRTKHLNRMRTKCMVKPYMIFEKGIHHVSKPIWAWLKVIRMDEKVFIHHYRPYTRTFGEADAKFVTDTRMLKYSTRIRVNIQDTLNNLRLSHN